jgi:hypothetical protein
MCEPRRLTKCVCMCVLSFCVHPHIRSCERSRPQEAALARPEARMLPGLSRGLARVPATRAPPSAAHTPRAIELAVGRGLKSGALASIVCRCRGATDNIRHLNDTTTRARLPEAGKLCQARALMNVCCKGTTPCPLPVFLLASRACANPRSLQA